MGFFGSSELILFSFTLFQIVKGINTHYVTLDVTKEASIVEIRSQYLKLVKQYHPDVNRSPEAQKRFVKIQTAWEVLKEPKSKKKYDQSLLYPRNNQHHYPQSSSKNRNGNGNGNGHTDQHQQFTFTANTDQNEDTFFQFNLNRDSFYKPNTNNFRSTQLLFESDRNTIGLTFYNFQQHFFNSIKSTVTICIAYDSSYQSKVLSQVWGSLTEKYTKYGVKFFAFNKDKQPDLTNYFQIHNNNNNVPQIFSLIETNENNNKYNKILFKDLDMSNTKVHFFHKFDDYIRSLFEKNNKITLIQNNKKFNNAKKNPSLSFRPSVLLVINNNNNNNHNNYNDNNNNKQKKIPLFYYYFSLKYYRMADFYLIKDSSILKGQLPKNNENFFLTIFNDKFNNFNNRSRNNNNNDIYWHSIKNAENNLYLIESTILHNKQMTVTRISGEETFSSICKIKDKYCVLWFTETNSKNYRENLVEYQDFAKSTSLLLQKSVNFAVIDSISQKDFCAQFVKKFDDKIIILNMMSNHLMRYIVLDNIDQLHSIKNEIKFPVSSKYRRIQLKEEIFYREKYNFNWYIYLVAPVFLLLISYLNWIKKIFNLI
ncbi:DNAj [Anaeramoeba flamelloides]|uniref:DNAj n=1 Tax=Anaeramoeba flamelloides TaxID=1746091 RepID=A0AAV7YSP3_9EUKA|nr:DNAj [Anaeramoeba flamelloides]